MGGEFQGFHEKKLKCGGSRQWITATSAPWQHGRPERHGGLFKDLYEKMVDDLGPTTWDEYKEIIDTACAVKNGFVNAQWKCPSVLQVSKYVRSSPSVPTRPARSRRVFVSGSFTYVFVASFFLLHGFVLARH